MHDFNSQAMREPTVMELMKLLSKATEWDDEHLKVEIGYTPARVYDYDRDCSRLDGSNWNFVVSTKICGADKDQRVGAQGKTLEQALMRLVEEIEKNCERRMDWWGSKANNVTHLLEEFGTMLSEKA